MRTAETITEKAPRGDSSSNGLAEGAVQEFEGSLRTWKAVVEHKYQKKMTWFTLNEWEVP